MPIYQALELSTAHIAERTAEWLTESIQREQFYGFVAYDKLGYGFFITVPDEWEEFKNPLIPGDLLSVLIYAKAKGCHWLVLDRDAEFDETLPTYKWT